MTEKKHWSETEEGKQAFLDLINKEYQFDSDGNINKKQYEYAEFGSSMPFRFLNPSQVTMYDGDGKEVMCACGKPATSGIIGKDAYVARCSDCFNGVLIRDV